MKQQDTYKEVRIFQSERITERVFIPDLTPEERDQRVPTDVPQSGVLQDGAQDKGDLLVGYSKTKIERNKAMIYTLEKRHEFEGLQMFTHYEVRSYRQARKEIP